MAEFSFSESTQQLWVQASYAEFNAQKEGLVDKLSALNMACNTFALLYPSKGSGRFLPGVALTKRVARKRTEVYGPVGQSKARSMAQAKVMRQFDCDATLCSDSEDGRDEHGSDSGAEGEKGKGCKGPWSRFMSVCERLQPAMVGSACSFQER